MKRIHAAVLLLTPLVACSSARSDHGTALGRMESHARLVGTWELVSSLATRGDSTVFAGTAPEFRALKIVNDSHYSVITRRGDQFLRAGAGRYTLSGDMYTETVDLASTEGFTPGAVYAFRIQINGDTWTLDGGSGGTRLQEVWRRVR